MKKRLFVALLSVCLLFTLLPATAFAEGEPDSGPPSAQSALCEHHPQHDESCGYTEGTEGSPCSHEHTEDCYTLVTECVHEHTAECYPAESVSENTATPSEPGEAEPTACTHECSEESGCITKTLDCKHEHDEACGYVPATEGTPCTFVCEVCNAQDSGNPATPSDAQPEECTCETLCTGEEINADCPVCSVEGAELDKVCVGAALLLAAPTLRTGGIELYVSGQEITESGCYENQDGTWTKVGDTEPANGQFHYDADSASLKLNNVSIVGGAGPKDTLSLQTTDSAASLQIVLNGKNDLTGGLPIWVHADHGNASLTITGDGTLTTTGTGLGGTGGIFVQSGPMGSTNGSYLTIENGANVISNCTQTTAVTLVAPAAGEAILTVIGGNLTADGGSSAGIYYGKLNGDIPSDDRRYLRIAGNSIIRRNRLSYATGLSVQRQYNSSSGGIIFDGNEGTVYGKVELQEDLEIGEGESLTLYNGASLSAGDHNVIVDGGTLDESLKESLGDSVKYAPAITTHPQNVKVKEKETATFTVEATGSDLSYQWQQSENGSDWTDIEGANAPEYTTGKATMDMNGTQYRCVVTGYGTAAESNAATLTVQKATTPIEPKYVRYIVEHYKQNTDGSYTLADAEQPIEEIGKTVTAAPKTYAGYTYNPKAAGTVDSGTLKEISGPDDIVTLKLYYDITLYTVTVNDSYAQTTGAGSYAKDATVTIDAGTRSGYTFDGWTSADGVTFANAGSAQTTFTMPGKAVTVTANWKKNSGGGGGSSRPTPSLSDQAIDDIRDARPGDTVEITLRPGRTTLEREVFEELAGQDITLEIDAGDGVLWTVNGLDIPEDTRLHDLDLDVDLGDSDIPATVLNAVTGEIGTVQLSLAHDGEFGFTMTLSAPLGRDNAAYWANLYWYNEETEELEFQQAARIAKDGTAEFALDHASDYAIVIDDRSHEPVDLPFNDVPESYWAYGAIQYVYGEGLMAGASGTTFAPEGTTTRGQIVTILWRLSGSPQVDYLLDFSDVAGGAYYTEAVRWAVSEGIAGGYGGGVFGPNDPITREQLAVMLHRYAQHEGYDVSIGEDTNILSYTDAFDVSEYAVAALQWACGAGIISGTGDGSTLTPQGEATRAQAATVLMRFCEEYQ